MDQREKEGEREIKVLLERNISVIWQHMFQMSALPVQHIYVRGRVSSKTVQNIRNSFHYNGLHVLNDWLKFIAGKANLSDFKEGGK